MPFLSHIFVMPFHSGVLAAQQNLIVFSNFKRKQFDIYWDWTVELTARISLKISKYWLFLPYSFLESVCLIRKHIFSIPERPSHNYPLRNAEHDIYLPTPSSELVKGSILYNARKMYNHLPSNIKSLSFFPAFRKALKSYLLERALYAVNDFFV